MKKLIYLIVLVLIVLSFPLSSTGQISNMKLTERFDKMKGKTAHSLHVYSTNGDSEIVVDVGENLISMNLKSIGYEAGYYTDISFKFDLEESFRVPLYCFESNANFVYSFEPYYVKKLIYHLKKYYVLRIKFPNNPKAVTFDLIGFIYTYDIALNIGG